MQPFESSMYFIHKIGVRFFFVRKQQKQIFCFAEKQHKSIKGMYGRETAVVFNGITKCCRFPWRRSEYFVILNKSNNSLGEKSAKAYFGSHKQNARPIYSKVFSKLRKKKPFAIKNCVIISEKKSKIKSNRLKCHHQRQLKVGFVQNNWSTRSSDSNLCSRMH